jgi:ApaG protein
MKQTPQGQSEAITQGIRVRVRTRYIPEQSAPAQKRYVFAYTIRIENQGDAPAQLVDRHWVITHGDGKNEEVRGPGVVGAQPHLQPGEHFEYTSGCVLRTPHGTMQGNYGMLRQDQSRFEATVAPFSLSMPVTLN